MEMICKLLIAHLWVLLLYGCNDCAVPEHYEFREAYDVVLVIGQSNTHAGIGLDPALDGPVEDIRQLGRFCGSDLQIIPAIEPLDHHTRADGRIGFALTFAKAYAGEYLDEGRYVLIIPAGYGGSGFVNNGWNRGDPLYEDAVGRVRDVLASSPASELAAILWHQGEADVGNPSYLEILDGFITDLRSDLEAPSVPFILGGMVPYWVHKDPERELQQQIIAGTPLRVPNTGYADPEMPFVIEKPDNTYDEIHYDAAGMRELGRRYFEVYTEIQ